MSTDLCDGPSKPLPWEIEIRDAEPAVVGLAAPVEPAPPPKGGLLPLFVLATMLVVGAVVAGLLIVDVAFDRTSGGDPALSGDGTGVAAPTTAAPEVLDDRVTLDDIDPGTSGTVVVADPPGADDADPETAADDTDSNDDTGSSDDADGSAGGSTGDAAATTPTTDAANDEPDTGRVPVVSPVEIGQGWVAQVSSVPTSAGSAALRTAYDNVTITFPSAVALRSSEWPALRNGYWVLVVPGSFDAGADVLDVCRANGQTGRDQCFGRFLSQSSTENARVCQFSSTGKPEGDCS